MSPSSDRFTMVTYDIPQATVKNLERLPTEVFRNRAIRVNLSCWIVKHGLLPYQYIEHLQQIGCSVYVVRYDMEDHAKIMEIARIEFAKEAGRIRESLDEKFAKVKANLAKAEAESNADDINKSLGSAKAALREAKKLLAAAEEAATAFDLLADTKE